jgi:hypothetical protein
MSVYVCLLATANVQALAQKSAAVVAVQSQNQKGAQPAPGANVTSQAECPAEEVMYQSIKLSSQDEKIAAAAPLSRATFCARLSTYLSLS